jgi:hypothetical protein
MSLSYIQTFKDTGNAYSFFEVDMPRVQALVRQLEVEFDGDERIRLCQEAEREVLAHWGGGPMPLYLRMNNILHWNYLHVGEVNNFQTAHNDWRDVWLDQTDPTWQGRPA